jgi:hypothetical protein
VTSTFLPLSSLTALRRFAWRVAGPRDFAINLVINGGIAWLLYHSRDEVQFVGGHSVSSMLLPMSFILTSMTTYFGFFNGIQFLKGARKQANPASEFPVTFVQWSTKAILTGLFRGILAAILVEVFCRLCERQWPDLSFSAPVTIIGLGIIAGCLAYVLHAMAVIRTRTFVNFTPDTSAN